MNAIRLTRKALRIHRNALVIDGHNDMPGKILAKGLASQPGFSLHNPQPELHTDIPRLREGGVDAQVWIACVPPGHIVGGGGNKACLEQIGLIRRLVELHPEALELARSAGDIVRISAQGKIASLIGVEGGHAIEHSLENLSGYRKLGAVYMTLVHNETHDWADAGYGEARHGGLSGFGKEVVRAMNRLGMLVDVSHASDDTVRDALEASRSPVIASHSSARALCGTRRNLPDELIRGIASTGGIVMVNFFPLFLIPEGAETEQRYIRKFQDLKKQYPDPAVLDRAMKQWEAQQPPMPRCKVDHLVDHIEHIIRVAGVDHVGLGSDYDGIFFGPDQMEDVSGFPCITQVLLNRGHSETEIRKILGENFIRVLKGAQQMASAAPG